MLNVKALMRATGFSGKLFYDEMFAYFDDIVLGFQLWNAGFKVISCPIATALHKRSASFGKVSPLRLYLGTRGYFALNEICNSRFKNIIRSTTYMRIFRRIAAGFLSKGFLRNMRVCRQ